MEKNNKKTIIAINECSFGSTGTINKAILLAARKAGFQTFFACHSVRKKEESDFIISKNKFSYFINKVLVKIDGSDGFHNKQSTKKLIKWLEQKKPDLIILNNMHSHYLNMPMLFNFCLNKRIKIIVILHDCWIFTGKCTHYEYSNCFKWKEKCFCCPQRNRYPQSYLFDRSSHFFEEKKHILSCCNDILTFVAPSFWMKTQLLDSYLSHNSIRIINHGINLDCESRLTKVNVVSEMSKKYKKVVFAAAHPFTERKGLSFVMRAANDRPSYLFIVAGLNKRQERQVPHNVLSLGVITNNHEMNWLYKHADVFLNPTLEETFGLTNIESLRQGTPVVCFDSGGAAEIIDNKWSIIVKNKNYSFLLNAIDTIEKNNAVIEECIKNAHKYDIMSMCNSYIKLINELTEE